MTTSYTFSLGDGVTFDLNVAQAFPSVVLKEPAPEPAPPPRPLAFTGHYTASGELYYTYVPLGGRLEVDGVAYRKRGRYCEGPMISLRTDHTYVGAPFQCSDPPTEQELDEWIEFGTMGGVSVPGGH